MAMTADNQWIDDIRQRIQAALNESRREVLREQYGMIDEYRSPDLPPAIESEFFDYVLEFERRAANAPLTTVRARIGDPSLPPMEALSPDGLEAVTEALMDLLAAHQIAVEFLGDVDYETVYRYLTEELLDQEIEDIRLADTWVHFTYATDEYNAETWVEQFGRAIFRHDLEDARNYVDDEQLWADSYGNTTTIADLEALWAHMPVVRGVAFEALDVHIAGDEGQLLGRFVWAADGQTHAIEASFQVYRSRYLDEAWGIAQTTLIDALREIYS